MDIDTFGQFYLFILNLIVLKAIIYDKDNLYSVVLVVVFIFFLWL